jgi:hypothetical protein
MTPKEKAKELVDKFKCINYDLYDIDSHKEGALIAVDEVINQCWNYRDIDLEKSHDYWQEVKQEIQAV